MIDDKEVNMSKYIVVVNTDEDLTASRASWKESPCFMKWRTLSISRNAT